MLNFPPEWKFAETDSIPPVPEVVSKYFHSVLTLIAGGSADPWELVEAFKSCFGSGGRSSSHGWAEEDLLRAMINRDLNAVSFVDGLWTALEKAKLVGASVPTAEQINSVLRRNGVEYEVHPPDLVRSSADAVIATGDSDETIGPGRYRIGDSIGRGGFGQVFVATRRTTAAEFEFALKFLDPTPWADREKATQRFGREIAALQRLQHRGIVPYVDAGVDQTGRPYIVMPLIRGDNIRDRTEGCSPQFCVELIAEVAAAVGYAHNNGVLHRDLKPTNILVRASDGQPLVLDFGNAFILDELDSQTLTTSAVGSIGYIPPEVLANPKVRSATHDVFALAVTLYELIARQRPDPLEYVPLSSGAKVPAQLDSVLRRALGPASKRPQSAVDFQAELVTKVLSTD